METINQDGEVIRETSGVPALFDASTAGALVRVEIDSQIATARQYPRSVKRAIDNILTLATLDEQTATECIYALPRGGKPIRGPSIRLADIVASQWGNCRDRAQVVNIDRVNKIITAEGAYHDLETNRGTNASVQRRISNREGKLFNDDMIAVTGNAACAIARRNAIFAGVPKGVWNKAVDACEAIIRGDAKTLVERRDTAIKALAHFGLSAEQVFKVMEVNGIEDIGLDDLMTLRVIYAHLKSGEQTVEDLLRMHAPAKQRVGAATADLSAPKQFATGSVPQADQPAKTEAANAAAVQSTAQPTNASDAPVGQSQAGAAAPAPAAASGVQDRPGPAAGAQAPTTEQKANVAQPPAAEDEPSDFDVIANDIASQLRACAGNKVAVDRVMSESRREFQSLDEPRQKKIDGIASEARKPKAKAA